MSVLGTAVMGNMQSVQHHCEESQVHNENGVSEFSQPMQLLQFPSRVVVRQTAKCKANLPSPDFFN